jgi:hypothetical protein
MDRILAAVDRAGIVLVIVAGVIAVLLGYLWWRSRHEH